jgi:enamine deaminase RidA (YjgF/YER057c/UK114 family)
MEQKPVNPWTWQDDFGFSQAVDVTRTARVLWCAGQASVDAGGRPVHPGDMAAQVTKAFDNLELVLKQAGLGLANVVRLNYYTTDVERLFASFGTIAERLSAAGCRPASTLLGVNRLAFPELLVELEATAVQ